MPRSTPSQGPDGQSQSPSVWTSALLPESELRSYVHLLTFDEVAKSRKLRQAADRERFLTGRILLRLALSLTVANRVHPSDWRFSAGRFGKPEMSPGLPPVHFNVSHAAQMAAVAIDPVAPIGVDIECADGFSAEIPSSVLAPRERLALARCDQATRAREFVRLWTLKEAHAKRLGLGVHLDFASFEIDWQPGCDAQEIETPDELLETRTTGMSGATYQVSVAREGMGRLVSWRDVNIAALAQSLL
jgi:4'-phosphopantetheinyl transferase